MDELDATQKRGHVGVVLGHVRLVGPDPVVQPGEELDVIRDSPRQLLRRVDVRVDKAWATLEANHLLSNKTSLLLLVLWMESSPAMYGIAWDGILLEQQGGWSIHVAS